MSPMPNCPANLNFTSAATLDLTDIPIVIDNNDDMNNHINVNRMYSKF